MINETSRLGDHAIKEAFENEEASHISEQTTVGGMEPSGKAEPYLSYFFVELFICSLLLWSLLFMSKSEIGVKVVSYVENILEEECGIEKVQVFEEKLEDAIRQII